MRFPGFIGGSSTPQSLIADAERTVNLYVEQMQSQAAANTAALFPAPGFRSWGSTGAGGAVGARGALVANGRLFFVIGNKFCEFSATAVCTVWGTVDADSNPAQLVYNGQVGGQVGIASGGSVYAFDLNSNSFTGPHFAAANITMLAYADGYGLGFSITTGKVFLSALNDLTSWTLGTFFQRSKFPDPWQAMFVDPNGLIWLIGTETFEVWYDANPASTQPWAPLSGLYGREGIASPFAYGVSNQGQLWLAQSGPEGGLRVVSTRGSVPQPVSTYAVNTALANYQRTSSLGGSEVLVYHDQGHTFGNLSIPQANATWSLDQEQRQWAERGQWNSVRGDYDVWAPRVHAYCFGKHLVGDRSTGTIWEMDIQYATDTNGLGIRRLRRTPALMQEHKRIPIDQLELLMDVGVAAQGIDPQVAMRVSGDGGRTWGNERRSGVGRIGNYRKRVYWTRLGAQPDDVFEFVWSDNAPTRVIDAWVNNAEKVAA